MPIGRGVERFHRSGNTTYVESKNSAERQTPRSISFCRRQIFAFSLIDFIGRSRALAVLVAEHALTAPAMAHFACSIL